MRSAETKFRTRIPVTEVPRHRAAERQQHNVHRAAVRAGERPDKAARHAEHAPGLAPHVHRNARDQHRHKAELHAEKPGPAEAHGLQYQNQQHQRRV